MIPPLVKAEMEPEFLALERKMVKIRALHKELAHILDAEYVAGMAYDSKSLKKLILRKHNCVNRFEQLVRSMGDQLGITAGRKIPATMSRTLVNHIKMIQGLTPEQKDILVALAQDLALGHRALMKTASRNGQMLQGILNRLSVTSKYVNHKNMGAP